MRRGDTTHSRSAERKQAPDILVTSPSHSNALLSQRSRSFQITLTSWLLSLLCNVLILYLLTILPQRHPEISDDALQVDMIHVPTERSPKARVSPRSRLARSSHPIKMTPPRQRSTPSPAVPLVTYARPNERVLHKPNLSSPDETMPVEDNKISVDLNARLTDAIPNASVRPNVSSGRKKSLPVDTPARNGGWLEKLRGEIGAPPQAQVSGSGREIQGHYNVATVQHEDAADTVRTEVLSRLVDAMNRWTKVHTKLLPGYTPLADPEIQRIPLVYITATSAFAFSEQERTNLKTYLQNGGTLFFSDLSQDWGNKGAIANSIRFELWKILDLRADLRPVESGEPICSSFFEFKKGPPLVDKKRGRFYVLRLNGRIAVFYDAAGLGLKWMENDADEKWMRWGVNLIVHTLASWR